MPISSYASVKFFLSFLPVLFHDVVDGIHHVEEELQAVAVVAGDVKGGGALYHAVFQTAFHFEVAQVFGKISVIFLFTSALTWVAILSTSLLLLMFKE